MAALEAVLRERGGRLGFNAKFMIEMGEETGSKGLADLVAAHKEDFAADVLIASDGPRVRPDRPTMTLGSRGAINFDMVCDLRDGALHSGNWGGLVADPGVILANALASIVGRRGELLVPALQAPSMSKAVKEALSDIEIDSGSSEPAVDPGVSLTIRRQSASTAPTYSTSSPSLPALPDGPLMPSRRRP